MNHECQVKWVRIKRLDENSKCFDEANLTIHFRYDEKRKCNTIMIINGEKCLWRRESSAFKWTPESSTSGVAVIQSRFEHIVIHYDKNNQMQISFFDNLRTTLEREQKMKLCDSASIQTHQGQVGAMLAVDNLIKAIRAGSMHDAAFITENLSNSRVSIKFNLLDQSDSQPTNIIESKSDDKIEKSSDSILELTLQIEYSMKEDPIIAPFTVCSGTTLQSLKQKIEKEIGIECKKQYWFAFKRYPIRDDYVFGSSMSVVPKNDQEWPPIRPIRSGDTLNLYISHMFPSNEN